MPTRRPGLAGGIALCITLTLGLSGCGSEESNAKNPVMVESNPAFPADSTMAELRDADSIRIGVKFDQPGVGYKAPGADEPEGYDIEMARIIAGRLGIAPEKIEWVEAVPKNREKYLRDGTVDLVLASYSITPERRKIVGMAGPYYETGQQLLVRKDDKSITGPADIKGKRVCSTAGSTSIQRVQEKYQADPLEHDTYEECVKQLLDGSADAVTTDGALLLGYASQNPDELKVVGDPFSVERYGVGYRKGDTRMCEFLNRTLQRSSRDGTWVLALSRTLWATSGPVPFPELDSCP